MKSTKSTREKTVKKQLNINNWNTSDFDEIERRKIRAENAEFNLENLDSKEGYFSSFNVITNQNKYYTVEIRSLSQYVNSCDCVDYRTNQLGTCKHIEFVLKILKKKGVRLFNKALAIGSQYIEIYLNTTDGYNVSVLWPKELPSFARNLLDPFFSADRTLLGDIEAGYDELCNVIRENYATLQPHIRVSKHIDYFIEYKKRNANKEKTKSLFLQDVAAGKRSLNLVKTQLLPYQQDGVLHLAFTERALLADEMGLGKTVQAIAAAELLKQIKHIQRVLIVTTASLKAEWEEQIAKFTDSSSLIIYGARAARLRQYKESSFFYIMNYEQVVSDYAEIQKILAPDLIVLDEAQRIKNWQTKTACKIKELKSHYAFVLTGTPIENRIDDIYSLIQFLDPHVFGPLFRFNRDFYRLDDSGKPIGYKNLHEMYHKLRPVMLCRKKVDVEDELPKRSVKNFFVEMDEEQRVRYEGYESIVARIAARAKTRALRKEEMDKLQRSLACMRMICDTPYILDTECRISPKIDELKAILNELLIDESTKIIIFSEWERMLSLVMEFAQDENIEFAWHTGSVDQRKRREHIKRFKNDPKCRLFLSTDSGSVGLNLQVANIVINLDLPWNPAKLEQRIARSWRKNQMRPVQVINIICQDSIEHKMVYLLEQKQKLAQAVLVNDENLSSMDMPSGRAAFLEKIQELMQHQHDSIKDIQKKNDTNIIPKHIEQVQEAVLQNAGFDLNVLNVYQNSTENKPVMLAVVANEKVDTINDKIQHKLENNNNVRLEIVDEETFATIQRLVNSGIITLNMPDLLLYDKNSDIAQTQMQKEQIKQANLHIEQASRKHKMTDVLINGGFDVEAFQPLSDAFAHTLQACYCITGKTNFELENVTEAHINEFVMSYKVHDSINLLFNEVIVNKSDVGNIRELCNHHQAILDSVVTICEQNS